MNREKFTTNVYPESSEFKKVCKQLNPGYTPPSRKTLKAGAFN